MAKVNKSGQHKPAARTTGTQAQKNTAQKNAPQSSKPAPSPANPTSTTSASSASSAQPVANKSKPVENKSRKPAVGGTAVTGARSTMPKEIPTTGPAQDRPERYNRETRRRMEHMGTGPYNDTTAANPTRKRYEKRLEERKKRQEEVKKTVVTKGPSTKIKIGNKNTYFLLAVLGIVAIIIIIALIVRHPF